ncbi:MAG: hypothetical protein PHZ09_13245 [Eubacteriales bacterium]|nr:hypothetical protein [Eubacteriales bacterium]
MTDSTAHAEKNGRGGNLNRQDITLSGEIPLDRKNTAAGSANVMISRIVSLISPLYGESETIYRSAC